MKGRAVRKPRFGDLERPEVRWKDDMAALRDLLGGMMMPLSQAEPGAITERCPNCHVPLHFGQERHLERRLVNRRWQTVRVMKQHRCTALDPVAVEWAPPLPGEA